MRPLAARPHGAAAHRAWTLAAPRSRRTSRGAWVALASTVVWALGAGTAVAAEVPDATLQVTGTVRVVLPEVVGDGPEGEVRTLVEADGVLHDLTGRPELEGAATGSDVVLTFDADRGVTAEEALTSVAQATGTDTRAPDGTAELVGVTPVEAPPAPSGLPRDAAVVKGVHTLTVLPVFGATPDGQTRATLTSRVQGVAQYWADQTGGDITFTTAVRDWVQYAEPVDCDPDAIWNSAMAAHGQVAVSPTDHVLVYFPYRSDCGGWAGLASVGGGQIWVNGTPTEDVVAHEVGHNLGLGHANTMTCGSGTSRVSLTTSGCTEREYRDVADVMGFGTDMRTGNLTTAAADLLGMLSAQQITATSVTAPVTVDLAPLADVRAVRAVVLPAPGISGGKIYVDFRPAVGRDVRRTAWAGVQVHLRKPDYRGIQQTYLLDMQPSTTTPFTSPAMATGLSWTVPGTGLTVTVHSVGTTARVTVESPSTPGPTTGTTGTGTGTAGTDTVAPSRAVVTAPAVGAVLTGRTVLRWKPSTDAVGVTAYDVVVDGRVVRRVGASTTSTDLGVLPAGPHSVAVDAVDAAGNRARGAAVTFTAVADEVQRYVARVYGDLFHRSPDRAGLLGWATSLSQGTPRVAVANAITGSDEYRSRLIQGSYATYLGRGADGPGLASWLDAMRRGLTIQQMEAGFVASPEYYLQSGSDDARWVTRLYQHVLGRTPAAAEVRHWQRELAAGSGRDRVAIGFLLSTEHLTTVVDGHYRDLLGRGIDPTGAAHWVGAIQRGTRVETIVGGIIASAEYGAR